MFATLRTGMFRWWEGFERGVKKAIYTWTEKLSLNRGGGLQHHLFPTYNAVLSSFPRKLNKHSHLVSCENANDSRSDLALVGRYVPSNHQRLSLQQWALTNKAVSIILTTTPTRLNSGVSLPFRQNWGSLSNERWNVFKNLNQVQLPLNYSLDTITWMTKNLHRQLEWRYQYHVMLACREGG